MKPRLFFSLTAWLSLGLHAQTHWRIEAESPETRIVVRDDTLDITSPKGLSLWWDEPMEGDVVISYRACVVMEGGTFDRLSDLNCFWMATDPAAQGEGRNEASPLRGIGSRKGRFVESYRLRCYYVGYGGNYNTTTRFRRYDADTTAVTDADRRPAILTEYTDSAHLLRPNHWYDVRLEVKGNHVRMWIDGECIVDYTDPMPLRRGWFALRTTWSHLRLHSFSISKASRTTGSSS